MSPQALPFGSCAIPAPRGQWFDVDAVLDDYLRLKDEHLGDQMDVVGPLLDAWMQQRAQAERANRMHGHSFNPLSRLKIDETAHSRILGDLLDPRGTHGQRGLFLAPFLEVLGMPDCDAGSWRVTVETGRVDILIWRNKPEKCAVIIENKVNGADDQPNQIYRYWHREMFLWEPGLWTATHAAKISERDRRFHVVYLPTDGSKAPESHSMERPPGLDEAHGPARVPLECRILALGKLMTLWEEKSVPRIPPENHRLRAFLSQYQELWNS